MHRPIVFMGIFLVAIFALNACAKPQYVRVETRPSFAEADVRSKNYLKKAAFASRSTAPGTFARYTSDLFTETMVATIQSRAKQLRLITPRHAEFPGFMGQAAPFEAPGEIFALTEMARLEGYHNLLHAAVLDVRAFEKQTGIWWFRKPRMFITVVVSLDVYDTFTAAKVFSEVMEETVKVDTGAYEAYQLGAREHLPSMDKAIAGMGKQLGRQAARTIRSVPWKAAVGAIDGDRITLAAGREAGLRVGDRWAVYEARRVMETQGGERFRVPGYKVGTLHITAVADSTAEARAEGVADIQAGDIAVPIR